jgi:hypothetical protein
MKSFGEHLLAERALDQPMRAAATKSFELMRRTAYRVLEKGLLAGARRVYDRYDIKTNKKEMEELRAGDRLRAIDNIATHYRNMLTLLTIARDQKGFPRAEKDLSFYMAGEDASNMFSVFMMRDMDGKKFLVFPSGITAKDFKRAYNTQQEPMVGVNMSSDYRTMGKNFTAGGTYTTPKVGSGPPLITINGMNTLKMDLYTMMSEVAAGVVDGKSIGSAKILVTKFMKKFDQELISKQNIYIHEYIHFLDDIRYKETTDPNPGNIKAGIEDVHKDITLTHERYYKSDAEWNAYFQSYAAQMEDAISSFLVACSNDRAVGKVRELIPNFSTLTPTQKGRELAEVVVFDMYRVMSNLSKEPWAQQKWGKDGSVSFASGGNALFRFCGSLIAGSLARYSTRGVSAFDIYMDDPKMKRKILQRIYQLTQDMEKVVLEYRVRMGQGKAISKQEWNKARGKFPRGGKGGYYGSDSASVYQYIYSGLLIGTEPFDPKKNQG